VTDFDTKNVLKQHTVNMIGKKYQIAVIGPIPRDHIITHNNEVIEKYGGINHAAIALANLFVDQAIIYPVAHVRQKDLVPIKNILHQYSNINLDHITAAADQGDIIYLHYTDQNERLEKQTGAMNPIVPYDIENILACDAFVLLPVTDFEIALETLQFIKKRSNGITIFDAHGQTTALAVTGDRLAKFWIDRDLWLPYVDILKMNLHEARFSWFSKECLPDELEKNHTSSQLDHAELLNFARHCFQYGVKALYITLADKGCLVYSSITEKNHGNNTEIKEVYIPAVKISQVIDTTGCGDAFAGGLAYGLLTAAAGNYVNAAYYANVVGALRTQGKTFEVFKSLQEVEKIIARVYSY